MKARPATTFCLIFAVLPALAAAQDAPADGIVLAAADSAPPKAAPFDFWHASLQAVAARFPVGDADADPSAAQDALAAAIAQRCAAATVEFHASVRSVRWSDGVAHIETESEIPEVRRLRKVLVFGAPQALRVTRVAPIDLVMEQQEAAAIVPGDLLTFRARLTFHPASDPIGGDSGEVPIYSIRREASGGTLGVFASDQYAASIGGKVFRGHTGPTTH
ncbi:MAG: hypothetical protein KDA41_15220 [Planctomycetales bacterium]|nr:hypothetical protein [Planctomycetales bacterium]